MGLWSRKWRGLSGRRRVLGASVLLLALGAAVELGLRFFWGHGAAPRPVPHPSIEYVNPASSELWRFGNRIAFNAYGMRGPDFPRAKQHPEDLRVLVLGDSVVQGTERLDQSDLATERARTELEPRVAGEVVVANVAANSWGPPNLLAYVREYGLFDADLAFIVLSSHDHADVPDPARKAGEPAGVRLAIVDLLARAVGGRQRPARKEPDPGDVQTAMTALGDLIDRLSSSGADVRLVLHVARDELDLPPTEGHALLLRAAREAGLDAIDLREPLCEAMRAGRRVYVDRIHLGPDGQRLLADVIVRETERWLATHQAGRPGPPGWVSPLLAEGAGDRAPADRAASARR